MRHQARSITKQRYYKTRATDNCSFYTVTLGRDRALWLQRLSMKSNRVVTYT